MTSKKNFRLLTVALQECTPTLNLAAFAALPGFEWIGDTADWNEGLRQILMTRPDVVVAPWSMAALKLLQALVYLRQQGIVPMMVAVTPETLLRELPPRDGVVTVSQEQIEPGLADRLRQLLANQAQSLEAKLSS